VRPLANAQRDITVRLECQSQVKLSISAVLVMCAQLAQKLNNYALPDSLQGPLDLLYVKLVQLEHIAQIFNGLFLVTKALIVQAITLKLAAHLARLELVQVIQQALNVPLALLATLVN
jgi:hypothetical protein